jgi:hypothetical protein
VLVTLADATTALLQQGQVVWLRTEALSAVLTSRFVVRFAPLKGMPAALQYACINDSRAAIYV